MKFSVDVTVCPLTVPDEVICQQKDNGKEFSLPIRSLDGEAIQKLCDEFTARFIDKAGAKTPPYACCVEHVHIMPPEVRDFLESLIKIHSNGRSSLGAAARRAADLKEEMIKKGQWS